MSDKRQQILIDASVQVDLLWQATKYWFFCLLTVSLFLFCWTILSTENQGSLAILNALFFQYGPAAAASIVVLPLIYYDLLRISHRFAGPIFKLRRALQQIAAGETIAPIGFREDDYWHDLAADFNAALARVQADKALLTHGDEGDTVVLNLEDLIETPLLTTPPDLIDFPALTPEGEKREAEQAVIAG